MNEKYLGCLYWCVDWSVNWYPIVFVARLPASLSLTPATERGTEMLHLPLDLYRSLSVRLLLAALLSLSSPPLFLTLLPLSPVFISVIFFFSHRSAVTHPPPPLALYRTHLHIPLFSSSECEVVCAPPYGLSSSSSECVGGVLHCNIAHAWTNHAACSLK